MTGIGSYTIINNCDVKQKHAYQSPGERFLIDDKAEMQECGSAGYRADPHERMEMMNQDFYRRLNHEKFYGQSSDD